MLTLMRFSVPEEIFVSVFRNAALLAPEDYGFAGGCKVFRFSDAAGNHAFAVKQPGDDSVMSFGSVILDPETASALQPGADCATQR